MMFRGKTIMSSAAQVVVRQWESHLDDDKN
jgi:hypothetical protein